MRIGKSEIKGREERESIYTSIEWPLWLINQFCLMRALCNQVRHPLSSNETNLTNKKHRLRLLITLHVTYYESVRRADGLLEREYRRNRHGS